MAASLSSNSDVTRRPGQALDSEASPPVAQEESTTASNRGTGHEVFAALVGNNLEFRTLRAGPNVTITSDADHIDITASGGGGGSGVDNFLDLTDVPDSYTGQASKLVAVKGDESGVEFITAPVGSGEANTASNVGAGAGVYKEKVGVDLRFKTLVAGNNVTITPGTDIITVAATDTGEANTASNLGSTGEGLFAQKSSVDLQFKKLKAGSNVALTSDSESITIAASGSGSGADFGGQYKNLVVTCSGTGYQGTITADRIIVEDSSYACSVLRAVSVSFNGANSGANGLDTGSMAAGNIYSLYVIYNGTTVASLISLSSTSPTLPSGYTKYALVGYAVVLAATTVFKSSVQRNNVVRYGTSSAYDSIQILSSGNATTTTDVSTTAAVPPNAVGIKVTVSGNTTGNTTLYDSSGLNYISALGGQYYPYTFDIFAYDISKVKYKVNSVSYPTNIYITGYFI